MNNQSQHFKNIIYKKGNKSSDIQFVSHRRVFEPKLDGILSEDNFHYLYKVLRLKSGDSFVITDGKGGEATAVFLDQRRYYFDSLNYPNRESNFACTLFLSLFKGNGFEFVLEKAVELGVKKIIPVISERCILKSPSPSKIERWNKIMIAAMLQCGGCLKPELGSPVKLSEIPYPQNVKAIFLHEKNSNQALKPRDLTPSAEIWLLSGPEGGFSQAEVNFLNETGWKQLWLGKRLLKADTAPIVAISWLLLQ